MHKLLIVDDEWVIREGLEKTIPWQDWQIEVVGTAKNGIEAWNMIKQQPVDLLLTDIRMPGLTGIELIAKVKEEFPKLKVVILTGHDEFDYAQKALKLGANDYLLKPTNVDELEATMKRMVQELGASEPDIADLLPLLLQHAIDNPVEVVADLETGDGDNAIEAVHSDRPDNATLTKLKTLLQPAFGMIKLTGSPAMLPQAVPHKRVRFQQGAAHYYVYEQIENETHWDQLIHELLQEATSKEGSIALSASKLTDCIVDLIAIYKQANAASDIMDEGSAYTIYKYHDRSYALDMERALIYIHKNLHEAISQSSIAEDLHMSNSYFSKLFKQYTGMTFVSYITEKRMESAKRLLRSTNLKSYEIASEVGYAEANYFSQLFKRMTGSTPNEYRRKQGG